MATKINFNQTLDFEYYKPDILADGIVRIIANNPSPVTFMGTGTYILGHDELMVIDAGPKDRNHLKAIIKYCDNRPISHIIVTHSHADHYPLSYELQKHCHAGIFGHKPKHRNADDDIGVNMHGFKADIEVKNGDILQNKDIRLKAIYTPGHSDSHYCFELIGENTLFCGDHIMAWSSTVVLPPDGNMTLYMENLQKIAAMNYDILYPTHGAPIPNPHDYIMSLINHRLERDSQIIDCLKSGKTQINQILDAIYPTLNPQLHAAAKNNIYAHLLRLIDLKQVKIRGGDNNPRPDLDSLYDLV